MIKESKESRLSVRVPAELLEQIKGRAIQNGRLMSEFVITALEKALAEENSQVSLETRAINDIENLKKRIETLEELVIRNVA